MSRKYNFVKLIFIRVSSSAVDNITAVGVRSSGDERRFISSGNRGGAQMAETTVKGFFEGLSDKLTAKPEKVAGMNCVYQFRVTDAAWNVKLADGKVAVAEGEAPSPNCTITMAEADFLDLVSGKLNGQMAFLTGKLKVAGDMGLALKLGSFIG
jgi:putative sterol carrier protein